MTRRQQMIQVLAQVQNDPSHDHHDILTAAGFLDTEAELANHIAFEFERSVRHMREFRQNKRGRYIPRRKAA